MKEYTKASTDVLDHSFDWNEWLDEGDELSSSAVNIIPQSNSEDSSPLTLDSSSDEEGVVTCWLSSGTKGRAYDVVNIITTSGGRIKSSSISIQIE